MPLLPKVTDLAAVRARGAAKQARGGAVRPGAGLRMRLPRRYAKFYSLPRPALTQRSIVAAFTQQFGLVIVWLVLSVAFWGAYRWLR